MQQWMGLWVLEDVRYQYNCWYDAHCLKTSLGVAEIVRLRQRQCEAVKQPDIQHHTGIADVTFLPANFKS